MKDQKKLIILDVHGVLLDGDYWIISRELSKKYKIPVEKVYKAIYKYHNLAALKKLPDSQIFTKGFKDLGIKESGPQAMQRHIEYTSRPNMTVVNYAKVLRKKGHIVIGLSKNVPVLLNGNFRRSKIKKDLDDVINTYDINLPKASKKTMRYVMKKFGIKNPKDIIYVDNQKDNLVEAKKMGARTIFYKNAKEMRKKIHSYL